MTRLTIRSAKTSALSGLALLSATLGTPATANTTSDPQELRGNHDYPALSLSSGVRRLDNAGADVAISRVILTVVTRVTSDGRIITQETVPHSMEECHRIAEMINTADGAGKYQFFAWCREA